MKLTNKLALLAIASFSLVANANAQINDYYKEDGKLLFKFRPLYSNTNAKQKNFSATPKVGAKIPSSFLENGYGFDTASTYFFADNFAGELSLGVAYYKAKKATLSDVSVAFGNGAKKVGKKVDLYMLPLTATVQYHLAPFGGIRPYIGAGGHGTYMYSRAKEYKIDHGYGVVGQIGADFVAKDDTFITFDVKQYMLESKITYKSALLGNNNKDVTSKVKLNPVVVSLGVGFSF